MVQTYCEIHIHLQTGMINFQSASIVRQKLPATFAEIRAARFFLDDTDISCSDLERVQFELHADNCGKPRDLLPEVRSPGGQEDVAGVFCQSPHHSCFIARSTFRRASVWKSSGMNSFIPWQYTMNFPSKAGDGYCGLEGLAGRGTSAKATAGFWFSLPIRISLLSLYCFRQYSR